MKNMSFDEPFPHSACRAESITQRTASLVDAYILRMLHDDRHACRSRRITAMFRGRHFHFIFAFAPHLGTGHDILRRRRHFSRLLPGL